MSVTKLNLATIEQITYDSKKEQLDKLFECMCIEIDRTITSSAHEGKTKASFNLNSETLVLAERAKYHYKDFGCEIEHIEANTSKLNFKWKSKPKSG